VLDTASNKFYLLFIGDTQEQVAEQDEDSDDVPGKFTRSNDALSVSVAHRFD